MIPPVLLPDHSTARFEDGAEAWLTVAQPTPRISNVLLPDQDSVLGRWVQCQRGCCSCLDGAAVVSFQGKMCSSRMEGRTDGSL